MAKQGVSALAIFLVLIGVARIARGQIDYLQAEWPILRLWLDAAAQARLQLGPDLYDMLTTADAVLPRDAAILLVTPGLDPRHAEYTAFHRALGHSSGL